MGQDINNADSYIKNIIYLTLFILNILLLLHKGKPSQKESLLVEIGLKKARKLRKTKTQIEI